MINLKKGLALVLAAATAFTFAPVANLGNAVQAEAAQGTNITIGSDAFKATAGKTTLTGANPDGSDVEAYQLDDGRGFYLEGVKVQAQATTENGVATPHIYRAIQPNGGIAVIKNGSNGITTPSAAQSTTKTSDITNDNSDYTAAAESDGKYYITVNVWVWTAGAKSITFADVTQNVSTRTETVLNIGMNGVKEESITKTDITVRNDTSKTGQAYTKGDTVSAMGNDKIYGLGLNDGKDYFFTYDTTNSKIQAWNGAELTIASGSVDPTEASGTLNIAQAYTDSVTKVSGQNSLSTSKTASDKSENTVVNGVWKVTPTAPTRAGTLSMNVYAKSSNTVPYEINDSLSFVVDRSDNAIDTLTFTTLGGNTITAPKADNTSADVKDNVKVTTVDHTKQWKVEGLDAQINNSGTVNVTAESGDISFKVDDPSILGLDASGSSAKITALAPGSAKLYVFVTPTDNNKSLVAEIDFTINAWAKDVITDRDNIDLDTADSKAVNAVKSAVLAPKSKGGLKLKMELVGGTSDAINFNDQTGEITSKAITGTKKTAQIKITTESDTTKRIEGDTEYVTVTVWTLPAAIATLDDVTIAEGDNVALKFTSVTSPNPYSVVWTNVNNSDIYTLSNPTTGLLHNNDQTTSRLYAKKAGSAKVRGTILGTTTTRPTPFTANVTVTNEKLANVITPADDSKSIVFEKIGDSKTITATASLKTDVTFDDSKLNGIATVAAGATSGSAIVTAVKPGKGVIVAKSAGAADYEIPVIVTDQELVVAPAKVTGVKVSNKKGAYVTVKWASQGKNINYRVWKKVGNGKWVGKNVAGSKTTLSVKKGAKVQVKVKSYVKDSTGKTTWGPAATKAKTFKTDKK